MTFVRTLSKYKSILTILNVNVMSNVLFRTSANDLETMIEHSKYYLLLSRVYIKQGHLDEGLQCLTQSREMQIRSVDHLFVRVCLNIFR